MAQTADERRERARIRMAARRAADRAAGLTQRQATRSRGGLPTARVDIRDRAEARASVAFDWRPFAAIDGAIGCAGLVFPTVADRGRMVVRAARHTFGGIVRADGETVIARVPRSDTWIPRAVARDRTWATDSRATDVRPCRHKRGHTATHSHGAPEVFVWVRRALEGAALLTFGHDPRVAALDRSVIAECAAATVPGYALVESFAVRAERMMRERREHVEGTWVWVTDERGNAKRERVTDACADCRNGERNTSWNATVRDVRAPMPLRAAVRAAEARLSRDWQTVPHDQRADATRARIAATRHADDWARVAALAALDARLAAYDERKRA